MAARGCPRGVWDRPGASVFGLKLVLWTVGVTSCFLLPMLASVNETPRRKNAIIFGPHPSAQGVDQCIENWLCAENYEVTKYVWGRGGAAATLTNLKAIAAGGYAVLVIICHGSRQGLTVEDYEKAADATAAATAYRANADFNAIRDEINAYSFEDMNREGRPAERYGIGITARGLRSLFGAADRNRSIVAVLACNSWELQTGNDPAPFGATEYLGFSGDLSNKARGKAAQGFYVMGGPEGIGRRPVQPAFEGKLNHRGPGNTTLASAVTGHTPAKDALLPLNVKTNGSTSYETLMSQANAEIMEPQGCDAVIGDQAWAGDCLHKFTVTPKKPGRLILKVKPKLAVSKNNNNWLVGNLYRMPKNLDECGTTRPKVDKCQFGQSGLDGEEKCVPPENPFRWCVWCGEIPQDPGRPGDPSKTPERMDDPGQRRHIPWGDFDGFILYQESPNGPVTFQAQGLPPNAQFIQLDDWYGHVLFTPDRGQVGQVFPAHFMTLEGQGVRDQRVIEWEIVERVTEIAAYGAPSAGTLNDLGEDVVRPGARAEYFFVLANRGNTLIRGIQLTSDGLHQDPATIIGVLPPANVQIEPAHIETLAAGETATLRMTVQTLADTPPGRYLGTVQILGQTNVEPAQAFATATLHVNRLPVVTGPTQVLPAEPGQALQIDINFSDPDRDPLVGFLELGPVNRRFTVGDGSMRLEWTPSLDEVGLWTIAFAADDGLEQGVHEVQVHVMGSDSAVFRRGDGNADRSVDISDAIHTLGCLFAGTFCSTCLDASDSNDSGEVDISDAVFTLNNLFLGGPEPLAPGPNACGSDPTGDGLPPCSYPCT